METGSGHGPLVGAGEDRPLGGDSSARGEYVVLILASSGGYEEVS